VIPTVVKENLNQESPQTKGTKNENYHTQQGYGPISFWRSPGFVEIFAEQIDGGGHGIDLG
jgi:hypothetical protein